jgi:hypothetical protein
MAWMELLFPLRSTRAAARVCTEESDDPKRNRNPAIRGRKANAVFLFAIGATNGESMTERFWCCALMTLLSAGVSAGFSLAGLLGPGSDDGFARYAASRSVALLLTVLIALRVRSRMAIVFLGIAMTVVQAFDGVIGALARNPAKTYGPFAFAVLNALAVGWLLRGQESHPGNP